MNALLIILGLVAVAALGFAFMQAQRAAAAEAAAQGGGLGGLLKTALPLLLAL